MTSEFVVILLSVTFLCVLLLVGRLKIEKDYFFMIFLFFGVLYVFVAPVLVYMGGDAAIIDGGESYPKIQALVIVLFLLPLTMAYRLLKNKIRNVDPRQLVFYLSEAKLILFSLFFLTLEVLFIILAFKNDMYFRRIGTEKIAEAVSGLDLFTLTILRTHDLVVLPVITLLAILTPTLKLQIRDGTRILVYMTYAIIVCSFIVFAVMNSRALLVFLVMALLYAKLVTSNAKIKLSGRMSILLAGALFYGLIVISNIRNHGIEADVYHILNPASFVTEENSSAFNKWEWTQRLDCVALIAQMDNSLQQKGYEWGGAWERPLIAAFGPLVGLDRAVEYKAMGITTAKTYLMEVHTDIVLKDYPSCMVTDLWGNFWIYGLPAAAILIAICFVLLRYGLTASLSPAALVISLVFAFYFVTFEKEFVDWAFGWVKLIPAIVFLVLLNPIKQIGFRKNEDKPIIS